MIHIEYLQVHYRHKAPVLSIDRLQIARGECVAVIGPSGAGKSTLLRAIKGYVRPSHGKIEAMGVSSGEPGGRDPRRLARRRAAWRRGDRRDRYIRMGDHGDAYPLKIIFAGLCPVYYFIQPVYGPFDPDEGFFTLTVPRPGL